MTPLNAGISPHFECNCVPDLGPRHCHRCSQKTGSHVSWDNAPCSSFKQTPLLAFAVELGLDDEDAVRKLISATFDYLNESSDATEAPVSPPQPKPVPMKPLAVPTPPKRPLVAVKPVLKKPLPHGWSVTRLAESQGRELGLDPHQLVELAQSASLRSPATGAGTNHYLNGLMILVNEDNPETSYVISVLERSTPLETGDDPRIGAPYTHKQKRAKSGGSGRRIPSNARELIEMMKEHGFEITTMRSGHFRASHRDFSDITLPNTPSDSRSLKNAIAFVKRHTGIDVTRKDS